ncbi:MAG: Asp-tRNA(Asn)/Glu-tRNA(Gln) amidotransferase subunit GatB [bacterium]|nr:Asp-tRNA(Asn)/Glu-tRNA(Gln) amidotransferase subunit GatB [bacterium]
MNQFEAVIGLEVHVQLLTQSKMFCGCSTEFGQEPNTLTCPVCLALPGALPVPNRKAVEFALRLGLALNCKIRQRTKFDRKNYFYPDLPKGYQISQHDEPICEDGVLPIVVNGTSKRIRIQRIHLEEDAGKSLHIDENSTFVDLNRCGVPLLEIVSKPDFRHPSEAYAYLYELRELVKKLEISSGNLEEGSMRCDANISLRSVGSNEFGTRTEIKNINSLRFVEKALTAEIERQTQILLQGGRIEQQTLTFDEKSGTNRILRSKEESKDYRYFPEPDLIYFTIPDEWIKEVQTFVPEWKKIYALRMEKYGISEKEAEAFTQFPELGEYFDEVMNALTSISMDTHIEPKKVAQWVLGEAQALFKSRNEIPQNSSLKPEHLAQILKFVFSKQITNAVAKELMERVCTEKFNIEEVILREGLLKEADDSIVHQYVQEVLEQFASQVQEYRSGKTKVFEFLVGQVMKRSRGKADPEKTRSILRSALDT